MSTCQSISILGENQIIIIIIIIISSVSPVCIVCRNSLWNWCTGLMLKGAGTRRVRASCKLSVLSLGRRNAGGASSKVCVLGREWRRGYASASSTELGNLGYDGEWDSFLELIDIYLTV